MIPFPGPIPFARGTIGGAVSFARWTITIASPVTFTRRTVAVTGPVPFTRSAITVAGTVTIARWTITIAGAVSFARWAVAVSWRAKSFARGSLSPWWACAVPQETGTTAGRPQFIQRQLPITVFVKGEQCG